MAASEQLFSELAKALSQPSKAYKAATEALDIPGQAVGGYYDIKKRQEDLAESRLKPYEIYSKIAEASSPDVANRIFKSQGIPVPDMNSTGGQSIDDLQKQFEANPMSLNPKMRTMLATSRNQSAANDIRQQLADAATERNKEKNFIGNDSNGNPLFSDKFGHIERGSVPALPSQNPANPKPASPGGAVLPKGSTMPTSSTRGSAEFATALLPHIQDMRNLVQQADAKGYIGPAAGRIYGQFLAGKVGSTGDPEADNLLGQLRTTDSLVKSGMLRTHFGSRGGQQMYDNFSNMLNSGKQSAAMLNGSLNSMEGFLKGYSEAGNTGQIKVPDNGTEGSTTGDPEADAAIATINAASIPDAEKQARISAVKARIGPQ